MRKAQKGDTVSVHYTGTLADGSVFDSSTGGEPLAFTIGKGQVIAGFEAAVAGLATGESRTVTIPAGQAYGEYREDFVIHSDPADIPPDIKPAIGMELTLHQSDGGQIPVRVTAVSETEVTLDANHPLSGKALTFEIRLVKIQAPES